MITLIDNTGYPVAVSTTGKHSEAECIAQLEYFNNFMEDCGMGRPYVVVVNESGDKFSASQKTS